MFLVQWQHCVLQKGPALKKPSHLLNRVCPPVFSPLKVSGQKAAATAPGEVPDAAQHPTVPGPEQASPPRLHGVQGGDAGAEALQEALCLRPPERLHGPFCR